MAVFFTKCKSVVKKNNGGKMPILNGRLFFINKRKIPWYSLCHQEYKGNHVQYFPFRSHPMLSFSNPLQAFPFKFMSSPFFLGSRVILHHIAFQHSAGQVSSLCRCILLTIVHSNQDFLKRKSLHKVLKNKLTK